MARGLLCWSGARPKDKTGDGNTVSAASLQKRTHTKKTIAKWTTGEAKNPVLNSGVGGHPPGGEGEHSKSKDQFQRTGITHPPWKLTGSFRGD